jgi:ribosomal protein S18 acetylase RimI-like enzyme
MDKILVRKMKKGDHLDMKKNIFPDLPLDIIEGNVNSNSEAMQLDSNNWVYFVAEINGEVVGITYLELKEKSLEKHIGELYSVVTSANHRGLGVCKALFKHVIEYMRELKKKKILVTVRTGTPAETVYQKLGFIKYGELPEGFIEEDKYINKSFYYYNID